MRYKSVLWAVVLIIALESPQLTKATSVDQVDLDRMTSQATAIVTAEVVNSEVDSTDNRFTTVVTLRVTDQIKGVTQSFIDLRVPGGSVRNGRFRVGQVNAGVPHMFADQEALLFLTENRQSNSYSLVGFTQGYMAILEENGHQLVQNFATDGKKISLEQMKESIKQLEVE